LLGRRAWGCVHAIRSTSNSFDMFLPSLVVEVFDSPFYALVSGLVGRLETATEDYLGRDLLPTLWQTSSWPKAGRAGNPGPDDRLLSCEVSDRQRCSLKSPAWCINCLSALSRMNWRFLRGGIWVTSFSVFGLQRQGTLAASGYGRPVGGPRVFPLLFFFFIPDTILSSSSLLAHPA